MLYVFLLFKRGIEYLMGDHIMTLDEYRAIVENAVMTKNGEIIFNNSHDHAAVLIENLFKYGQGTINVLSGTLNASVFCNPGVLQNIESFLGTKDNKIRILLDDQDKIDKKDHMFISKYSTHKDIQFKKMREDLKKKIGYHFVVNGNNYRFEKNKQLPSAIAAFGDLDFSKTLHDAFEKLWNNSDSHVFA